MKVTFTKLLIAFFLFSCHSTNKKEETDLTKFIEREVPISTYSSEKHRKDTVAILTIKLPERLDTSYQRQRYPDMIRGSVRRFRFIDSRYPLRNERENLYYYLKPADSLYQFTVSYTTFTPKDTDTILPQLQIEDTVLLQEEIDRQEFKSEKIQWSYKKLELINDRPFMIAAYQIPSICRENEMKVSLFGITRIKRRELIFRAECDAKDTTGFLSNMYQSLLSVRVKENP